MKMLKVIKPLVPVAMAVLGVGYIIKKGKIPVKSFMAISDIAGVTSDATSHAEKSFGGLMQFVIDEIVSNTPRGVKAIIEGDTLEYFYRSGSGKKIATEKYKLDAAGNLVRIFRSFSDAKSPRFFIENLRNVMNKFNENL